MITKPTVISGLLDISTITGGLYFTSIFYGETPEVVTLNILEGGNNDFTSIQIEEGSVFEQGSIIIGSNSPSGVLQVFDLNLRSVSEVYSTELESSKVEDFE